MGHRQNRYFAAALLWVSCVSHCMGQVVPYISEKKATWVKIEIPGALGTYPMAINDSMTVTGYYKDSPTTARAFIRDGQGAVTIFSVPNSVWTEPEAINAAGDITGFFEVEANAPQGFVRYANGRFVTFNPPDSWVDPSATLPLAINDYDEVAGNQPFMDFTRSRSGAFLSPGSAVNEIFFTTGLNDNGAIVGYEFIDVSAGYVVHPDGYFEKFYVYPSSLPENFCSEETVALDVNNGGTVAGWYAGLVEAPGGSTNCVGFGETGGFVRSPQGAVTVFQTPGPIVIALYPDDPSYDGDIVAMLSRPSTLRINVEGIVMGTYTDMQRVRHGFVREADGILTSFDPPRGKNTTATGINGPGVIVGSYFYDWNDQISIGFLRIPTPAG